MRTAGKTIITLAVAGMTTVAAACGGVGSDTQGGSGGTADGGGAGAETVVIGSSGEPSTLDAQLTDDQAKDLATWSVNEALVDLDLDGEVVPQLAAEVPKMLKNDPTRWRVKLREGISFTNGEPFDAKAVKANVERIIDPEYNSTFRSELPTLTGAEVIDEYTVDLITKRPDPILDYRLRTLRMVPPKASQDPGYGDNGAIGTGPMMVETWEKGQRVVLERNPDYWGDNPATIGRVELRFIPDVTTRVSALQAGEIDIAEDIPTDQLEAVPAVIESATPVQAGIHRFNLTKHPYSDPNFRRALNYAVDKQELNEGLFNGTAEINKCQPVTSTVQGFNENLEPYPYDPEKARQLLSKVDLPQDFVLHFDGTTGVYVSDREAGLALTSYWEDIGLTVDPVFDNPDQYLDKIFAPNSPLIYARSDQAFNHAARQTEMYYTPDGSTSAVGDTYPQLRPFIRKATTATSEQAREQAYNEILKIGCEDAFFVYTLDVFQQWGAAENIEYEPGLGELTKFYFNRLSLGGGSE